MALSCIVSAISNNAPFESVIEALRSEYSLLRPSNKAFNTSIWVFPPIIAVNWFLWASVQDFNAESNSLKVPSIPLKFSSVSQAETPKVAKASLAWPLVPIIFTNTELNPVPASLALIPLLAKTPNHVADSSKGTLRFLRVPPHPI